MFDTSRCLISNDDSLELDINRVTRILKNYWYQKHSKRDELKLISFEVIGKTKVSITKYGILITSLTNHLPIIFDIDLNQKQI